MSFLFYSFQQAVYHQEFDEALKVYNENRSRADRKNEDYFEM